MELKDLIPSIFIWLCLLIFHSANAHNFPMPNGYFATWDFSGDSLSHLAPGNVTPQHKPDSISYLEISATQEPNDSPLLNNDTYSLQKELVNYLFLIVSIIGFLMAIRLLAHYKKEGDHNIFLALFLIGISVMLTEMSIYWQGDLNYHPKVYFFRIHFFLWAPSLYLYNKKKLSATPTTTQELAMHYGLFFIFFVLLLLFVNTYNSNPEMGSAHRIFHAILQNHYIKAIHITFYFLLLIMIFKNRQLILDRSYKRWLVISITFLGIIMLTMYFNALFGHIEIFDYIARFFTALLLSLFICLCAVTLFIQPEIITKNEALKTKENNKVKYKNSGLTEAMTYTLKTQLLDLVENKKVYLDNTITLGKLAKELNTDRYSLSQIINQEFGKNFYEFINDYRIQEAITIIEQNHNSIKVVADLIYESGFNNKVSFYKAFKKKKKMTPTEYLKLRIDHKKEKE